MPTPTMPTRTRSSFRSRLATRKPPHRATMPEPAISGRLYHTRQGVATRAGARRHRAGIPLPQGDRVGRERTVTACNPFVVRARHGERSVATATSVGSANESGSPRRSAPRDDWAAFGQTVGASGLSGGLRVYAGYRASRGDRGYATAALAADCSLVRAAGRASAASERSGCADLCAAGPIEPPAMATRRARDHLSGRCAERRSSIVAAEA